MRPIRRIMKLLPATRAAFALVAASTVLRAEPAAVAFDWFEYSGTNALETKVGAGEYQNPILTGFYPDPSICRAGEDFYLINSTFAYFPGIPIFHSRDLVNWHQIGHVIHRPEQLRYDRVGVSGGIFAPAISHHENTFYVVCTQVGGNGNFVVTATDPAGPWSDPTELRFEGIDPSLFFDDDGRAWTVNNGAPEGEPLYNGHRAIWIQEFDPAAKRMIGPRTVLVNGGIDISKRPIWIEGPHLYKVDGWYYLCCAEGGTGPQHSQVILRSRKVDGPYTPWEKNPILTQRDLSASAPDAVTCTGHADLVIGPDKNWWAVFLGVRPYQGRYSPMGRETFLLPVIWTDDGWPTILPPGERVPMVGRTSGGVSVQPSPALPLNGDFTWRDEFQQSSLSPAWIMLRTPRETWWSVDAGKLKLTPRKDPLSGRGNPSFLGRRVQHARFTASTSAEVPGEPGISAGLAVFQGERHHYFARVQRETNGLNLALERWRGRDGAEVVQIVTLPEAKTISFRVMARDAKCSFEYAADSGSWRTLAANQDATLLTTDVAGGFVGATVGPHARMSDGSQPAASRGTPEISADAGGIRVNAGCSTPFTDSTGRVWLPDRGFDGGSMLDRGSTVTVSGSSEAGLYASERYSMSAFAVRIPNGRYLAKLHFAETYDGITGPGQRVFSFIVQGQEFRDFDVWVKAGGPNRAHVETVPVEITNGVFQVDFIPNVENPQINAIELLPRSE